MSHCIKLCLLVFFIYADSISAFLGSKWLVSNTKRSSSFSIIQAHKLDGIEIAGDFTPLSNNCLIKVKEVASSTKGGLFIPDNAKERPTEGKLSTLGR